MRIMPRGQRKAMFESYAFCRARSTIIAGEDGPRGVLRTDQLQRWRADIDARCTAAPLPQCAGELAGAVRRPSGLAARRFYGGFIDGMEMDVTSTIRAPDLATLDLYCRSRCHAPWAG